MKLNLDTNPKTMSLERKIIYISILVICVLAILIGAYIQVFKTKKNDTKDNDKYVELSNEQYTKLEEDFSKIFNNKIVNNSKFDISKLNKIDKDKEVVDIEYVNVSSSEDDYNLNVTIPFINIKDSTTIQKYNAEIKSIFKQKALDIINNENKNTVYTVEYVTYINNNVLSLAIKSTLKEGNNAQRVIIKTYNYNLEKNKMASLDNLLEEKGISSTYAESKVREKIKIVQERIEGLQKLGYNLFERDYKSALYKMQNTKEFFLGENGCLYIIYAYGNENYTDELDLVIM